MERKLTLLLAMLCIALFGTHVSAQTIASPDTVCAGETGTSYWVNGTSGSTFHWTVNGGTQATGGTSDSITVDWPSSTGVDTIVLVEETSSGCFGDTIYLPVVRMPLPTAAISDTTQICYNDSTTIQIALTGTSPWTVVYSDGSTSTTINTSSSNYTFNTGILTTGITTYSLVSVEDRLGCTGSTSGAAPVTVSPKPSSLTIMHQ